MKLDAVSDSLLFSSTNIPDAFFTEYFSQASPEAIKVYLYMFFLAKYGKDIRINDLYKKLNLSLKDIQDSIKYWENIGLLIRKNAGYEFANIQEIELHKLYNPKVALSTEDIKNTKKNQYRAQAIENINNEFFQGVMSPSWYGDIELWFSKYSFDEEVMVALFRYCFNRSALHRNYIQTVADAWYKNKVKTFSDLEEYFQNQENLTTLKKKISKKLGITRPLTEYEEAYIIKWTTDFDYGMDIIEIALKRTTLKSSPTFNYLDTLISSWHEHGLKTPEEINAFIANSKQKDRDIKNISKKANYNSYEQRSLDDFSNVYANIPNKK